MLWPQTARQSTTDLIGSDSKVWAVFPTWGLVWRRNLIRPAAWFTKTSWALFGSFQTHLKVFIGGRTGGDGSADTMLLKCGTTEPSPWQLSKPMKTERCGEVDLELRLSWSKQFLIFPGGVVNDGHACWRALPVVSCRRCNKTKRGRRQKQHLGHFPSGTSSRMM